MMVALPSGVSSGGSKEGCSGRGASNKSRRSSSPGLDMAGLLRESGERFSPGPARLHTPSSSSPFPCRAAEEWPGRADPAAVGGGGWPGQRALKGQLQGTDSGGGSPGRGASWPKAGERGLPFPSHP